MKNQWMDMKYNKELGSWFIVQEKRGFMIHCGEWFNLCVGQDSGVPCRLELAKQWYVIMGSEGVKLNLRTNEIYKIEV